MSPSGQGKAGAAWGCRPTEHPLPTPAGNPAGSRICSDLALARSIFRENRRVPQSARQAPPRPSFEHSTYLRAACKPFCFREKRFVPPARWARLSAAEGRAVARRSPAWPRWEEPGAAVRVTQRAKEGRRAVGLGRWAVTRDCPGGLWAGGKNAGRIGFALDESSRFPRFVAFLAVFQPLLSKLSPV